MAPGPLPEMCKLLFHKAALMNLERLMLIFSLPLSELVTRHGCKPTPPLIRLVLGHLPSTQG